MGNRYPGRNMWLAVGIQSAKGTPAHRYFYMQPTDVGGFLKQIESIASDRRVGTRFSGSGHVGQSSVPFNFTVEANPGDIGVLLYAALGSETASVSSDEYTHKMEVSEDLPYITILLYSANLASSSGAGYIHRITDAKIGSMTLNGEIDSICTLAIDGIGIDSGAITNAAVNLTGDTTDSDATLTNLSTIAGLYAGMPISGTGIPAGTVIQEILGADSLEMSQAATVTDTTVSLSTSSFSTAYSAGITSDSPFFVKSSVGNGKVSIGATVGAASQFDETRSFSLVINNGIERDSRIDYTSNPFGIEEGASQATGEFDCIYNDDTFAEVEAFEASTARGIIIFLETENLFDTDKKKSLTINIYQAKYNGDSPSWDPDVISINMPFDIDVAEGLEFELYDDQATEYDVSGTAIT